MRSALTALGVIIGVAAVIAVVAIGQGSKTMIQKQIASMGANNILVLPGAAASGGVSFGVGSVMTLTPDDSDEIARQCPAVSDTAPIVRAVPRSSTTAPAGGRLAIAGGAGGGAMIGGAWRGCGTILRGSGRTGAAVATGGGAGAGGAAGLAGGSGLAGTRT